MRERGFDYRPPFGSGRSYPEGEEPGTGLWKERYGFGVTTEAFAQPLVGDELVGHPPEVQPGEQTEEMKLVAQLSGPELKAYTAALMGADPPPPTASSADLDRFFDESDGCLYEAQRDAIDATPAMTLWLSFEDELADLQARIAADPAMLLYERDITQCVAESGMTWVSMHHTRTELQLQVDAIRFDTQTSVGNPDLYYLSEKSRTELARLQEYELTLARLVFACEAEIGSRDQLFAELRVGYEHDFIQTNSARLRTAGLLDER